MGALLQCHQLQPKQDYLFWETKDWLLLKQLLISISITLDHYLAAFIQVFRDKCNNTCLFVFIGQKLLLSRMKGIVFIGYNVLTPNRGSSGMCICLCWWRVVVTVKHNGCSVIVVESIQHITLSQILVCGTFQPPQLMKQCPTI